MANPNDAVFEIDAGKILAKLHLAGLQLIPNSIVINTGIKNPVAKGDPKNPGNTEFDLENKSGDYQFAVMRHLYYQVQLDLSKNKKLVDIDKKLLKLEQPSIFSEDSGTEKTEEKPKENNADLKSDEKKKEELDNKTSLTDKDALKKTEVKKESLEIPSFMSFITEADDKDNKEEEKKKQELKKIYDELFKELDSIAKFDGRDSKKNMFTEGGYQIGKHEEGKEQEEIKLFKQCVLKENEARQKYKLELTDKLLKESFADIKTYFKTVSGELNASKIKLSDIVPLNADVDGKTKDPTEFKDIKDYKITTESVDKLILKEEEKIQKTKPNEWIDRNIMLAIGFSVEIEAM